MQGGQRNVQTAKGSCELLFEKMKPMTVLFACFLFGIFECCSLKVSMCFRTCSSTHFSISAKIRNCNYRSNVNCSRSTSSLADFRASFMMASFNSWLAFSFANSSGAFFSISFKVSSTAREIFSLSVAILEDFTAAEIQRACLKWLNSTTFADVFFYIFCVQKTSCCKQADLLVVIKLIIK